MDQVLPEPPRRELPDTRRAINHRFQVAGVKGYIIVGLYEDNTPGEIFVVVSKEGSTIGGLMDGVAKLTSIALQYGIPLSKLAATMSYTRFEPSGFTTNSELPEAFSIIDYVFRWLELKFCKQVLDETKLNISIGNT